MDHREILELERDQDFRNQALADLRDDFIEAALAGDMSAEATWAPRVIDYKKPEGAYGRAHRYQKVGEILSDQIDDVREEWYVGISLLCRAAKGEDIRGDAMKLLQRAADRFVEYAEKSE